MTSFKRPGIFYIAIFLVALPSQSLYAAGFDFNLDLNPFKALGADFTNAAQVVSQNLNDGWLTSLRDKLLDTVKAIPKATPPQVRKIEEILPNLPAPEIKLNNSGTIEVTAPRAVPGAAPAAPSVVSRVAALESQLVSMRELMTRQSDRNVSSVTQIIHEVTTGGSSDIAASSGTFGSLSVTGGLSLGTATTSASNGFNISAGCFSIGGVCIAGGGGGSVSGTYPILANSNVVSLAFGTTTNNLWGGEQTFLASTTLQKFTAQEGTTTSFKATTITASGVTNSLLKTNAVGQLVAASAGTDYLASMTFAFPFKTLGSGENSTNTTVSFHNGLLSTASSTLASTTVSTLLSTNATATNLAVTSIAGGSIVKTLSGGLGALAAAISGTDFLAPSALFTFGRATTTEFSAGTAFFGRSATTTINGTGDLFVVGSTTLQSFTATQATIGSATSTNFLSTNILAFGSTTLFKLFSNSATATNLYSTNFLASASSTFQSLTFTTATGTSATTTNFAISGISAGSLLKTLSGGGGALGAAVAGTDFLAPSALFTFARATTTEFSAGTAFFGRTATTTINGQGDLFVTGSTTLQKFTATEATTTNLFSVSAQFGSSANDAINFISGNFRYLSRATTTLQVSDTAWVIATNTAATAAPLMSFNNSAGTSTIQFFGATTTGLTAGTGMGIPMGNFVLIGDGRASAGLNILKGGLCVDNDGWCTATTSGRISSVSSYLGGADIAEMYQAGEYLEAGDVVSILSGISVSKAVPGGKDKMMGVVSTNPGVVLGSGPDREGRIGDVPIALAGRVPVKVSAENGAIKPGDYLMLSSQAGVAAKALKAGTVIGQALESFAGGGTGKILVFVKNSYYSGLSLDNFPGLTTQTAPTAEAILTALESGAVNQSAISSDLTADRMLAAVEIITPKITAGLISAKTIESPTIDALNNRITMETAALKARIDAHDSAIQSLESRVAALESASSTSFSLAAVSAAVNGIINSASEWVVSKITAVLGVFERIEVGTARVSKGIEMVDSETGQVFCMTIKNNEWEKKLGPCASPAPEAASSPSVSDTPAATTTEDTIEPQDEPVIEDSGEPAPAPEPEASAPVDETQTSVSEESAPN